MTQYVYLLTFLVAAFQQGVLSNPECGVLKTETPSWNVGIYRETKTNYLELICLGTAVKTNAILTAAHCFYDQSGKLKSDEFYVSTKTLDQPSKDNKNLQKVDKTKIQKHHAFKSDTRQGNVALVGLLKADFVPICIDWDNTTPLLEEGEKLRHPSWQNNNIQLVDVSYVDYNNCDYLASNSLRKWLTSDKICAKSNKEFKDNVEDGAGLMYFNFFNSLWYMRGVVSGRDPEKTNLIIYSDIVLYLNWLSSNLIRL